MPDHYLSILAGLIAGMLLVIIPIVLLSRKAGQAHLRSEENLCLKCGYDLRASKGRCPECGEQAFRRLDKYKLRKPFIDSQDEVVKVPIANLSTVVHQTTDAEEARLLVLQLEARNIPALRTDGELANQPFLTLFAVRVSEEHKVPAARVVAEFELD